MCARVVCRLNVQHAVAIDATGKDSRLRLNLDRDRFAGDRRLIDRGMTGQHDAVDWYSIARTDDHDLAHVDLCHRNDSFAPVANQCRLGWNKGNECFDRATRAVDA